jgi:hypothetical protein
MGFSHKKMFLYWKFLPSLKSFCPDYFASQLISLTVIFKATFALSKKINIFTAHKKVFLPEKNIFCENQFSRRIFL